jgi:hypothetical protein
VARQTTSISIGLQSARGLLAQANTKANADATASACSNTAALANIKVNADADTMGSR